MTYPLLNLAQEIRLYCEARGITRKQLSVEAGVSASFIDRLVADIDPVGVRQAGKITKVLNAMGYSIYDFDPRVTEDKIRQAVTIIKRQLARGFGLVAVAAYLGIDSAGTLRGVIDQLGRNEYDKMRYDKLVCLQHAFEPDFIPWCEKYAINCTKACVDAETVGGKDRKAFAPTRPQSEMAYIRKGHDEGPHVPAYIQNMRRNQLIRLINKSKNTKLPGNPEDDKLMLLKLMRNIGFESFADAVYDAEQRKLSWDTATCEYHCELTWDRFKAWFTGKGEAYLSSDRDIRVWHTLSNYDMAYLAE